MSVSRRVDGEWQWQSHSLHSNLERRDAAEMESWRTVADIYDSDLKVVMPKSDGTGWFKRLGPELFA